MDQAIKVIALPTKQAVHRVAEQLLRTAIVGNLCIGVMGAQHMQQHEQPERGNRGAGELIAPPAHNHNR